MLSMQLPGNPHQRFGRVSFAMLVEGLRDCCILHKPKRSLRRFSWYEICYDDRHPGYRGADAGTLLLCRIEQAKGVLQQSRDCFCLVLTPASEVPDWVSSTSLGNRVILVKQVERFMHYESILQKLFVKTLVWENEMDRVVYSHGRLDRLIAVSESSLNEFVCITDTGFNLIAYSREVEPPEDSLVYKKLIEDGCYTESEIKRIEEHVLPVANSDNSMIVVIPPDDDYPHYTLHYPIYIDHSYLFHVTMVCTQGSTARARDLFEKFVKRVVLIASDFWKSTVNLEAPWHRVLIGLINGDKMTDSYLKTQLAKTEIPKAQQFRLLFFPFSDSMEQPKRAQIVADSRVLNKGNCYPFVFEGELLVLEYTDSSDDAALSGKRVYTDTVEHMSKPFDLPCGVSQVFRRIQDIEIAYRQACAAYALRGPMMREAAACLGVADMSVFPFEHALKFYLLVEGHDHDLVEFAFDDCILGHLIEADAEAGTNIAQMIWTYISHGRNATETAKLMHVHRNTVLYHLSRIEKQYDISFDSPVLRSRMVLDCQRYLLDARL